MSSEQNSTPSKPLRVPKSRKHKGSGQAIMTLNGGVVYLGKYGAQESYDEYNRRLAELFKAAGQQEPTATALAAARSRASEGRPITVVEACSRYVSYLAEHKGPGRDGLPE
jgi:hypothetical protein